MGCIFTLLTSYKNERGLEVLNSPPLVWEMCCMYLMVWIFEQDSLDRMREDL